MGNALSCPGSDQAGASAGFSAFMGAFGLGGLDEVAGGSSPTADATNQLNTAKDNLAALQKKWQDIIDSEKEAITEDQIAYLQDLVNFSNVETALLQEKLFEQSEKNTLLIGMLMCLVIFLILFDIL